MDRSPETGRAPRGAASTPDELTEAVFDTVRDCLLILDDGMRVRRANRAFLKTFRVTPQETVGRPIYELGNGNWDVPALRLLLETIIPKDSGFEDFEVAHEFPSIGRRVMLLNGRRLRGPEGELILLAFEDVTRRLALERELRRSNEDLSQFASVASHDLQEPLRMVVSYMQLLSEDYGGKLDEDAREYVRFAADGASRMQRLIADLLAYARLDRAPVAAGVVELDGALDSALRMLESSLAEAGARVERSPLPAVTGAPLEYAQLFQNLVGNALKFRGEKPLIVKVRAERGPGSWIVRVSDNGRGIAPEHREKVFAIFERLHGAEIPGTGIGLALCRKIIDRREGRIWAEPSDDGGACLAFSLPAPGETE